MNLLLKIIAALLGTGSCVLMSFLLTSRMLKGTNIMVRLVGGVVLGYWLAAWGFQILGLLGWFDLKAVAPIVFLVAVSTFIYLRSGSASRVRRGWAELKTEIQRLRQQMGRHRWLTAGLCLIGIHVAVRGLRTLATPAFGWDDFTYHLFRAGRWVQNGGLRLEPAPDAWTYYEFFPWGGDLIWAWALVWQVGDVLVPVAAIALWCFALVAGYAVAVELSRNRLAALTVAVAMAVLPSQVSQMSTAYVDNAVLAMVLSASLFLLILLRPQTDELRESAGPSSGTACALMLGASCGLGLMVKMSFLPLLAPAAVISAWHSLRRNRPRELVSFLLGVAVAAPNLVFNWVQRGSPFYPFEIVKFLPHNEQHSWILGKYGEGATVAELTRAAKALVFNLFPLDPFLNMGLLGVVLIGLGSVGSVQLFRTRRGRWFLLWIATGAALTLASFFSPRNSSMVAWWTLMMARFLVPSLAGLMVASCLVRPTLLRFVLAPMLVAEYFYYARRGWPAEQVVATFKVAALVSLAIVLAAILIRRVRSPVRLWSLLAMVFGLVLLSLIGVRERYRYEAYRLFAERSLLDFHGAPPVSAWPIWQRLDETGPNRVAASAGFDGLTGHNWFRSALLGAWLQNEVLYLPVTSGGELVSYRDREALLELVDRTAWLTRVHEQRIDRVVALGPGNIEHRWILDLPEVFEIEIRMGRNHFLLARVDHEALNRLLEDEEENPQAGE